MARMTYKNYYSQATINGPADLPAIPEKPLEALYVHVPFCLQKCRYCDFYSLAGGSAGLMEQYVEAVMREAESWGTFMARTGSVLGTVFFGGGTPTALPQEAMSRLLRAAHFQPVTYSSAEVFLTDVIRPKFACLVLDTHLPGISGVELSKRLLAVKDTTPIVFVTEQDPSDLHTVVEMSTCAGYFSKTVSGADVLAAICRAINPPAYHAL